MAGSGEKKAVIVFGARERKGARAVAALREQTLLRSARRATRTRRREWGLQSPQPPRGNTATVLRSMQWRPTFRQRWSFLEGDAVGSVLPPWTVASSKNNSQDTVSATTMEGARRRMQSPPPGGS